MPKSNLRGGAEGKFSGHRCWEVQGEDIQGPPQLGRNCIGRWKVE